MKKGIGISRSFVLLALAGGLVTLLAWQAGGLHAAMFLLWNALLIGAFLLDALITPSDKHFTVRRDGNDILYFKAVNNIEIFVENKSRSAIHMEVLDERTRHFPVEDLGDMKHWLPPREEIAFSYAVTPNKRGSFPLSKIYLRYSGLLGLCVKYVTVPCPIEYKVYPNILELGKFRLMLQKNRLLPHGDKTIKNHGMGYEFESLRNYVEGDDFRRINWRATARESKLIVNQFQTERNQPVYILLDISRPMSYSVKGYKKLDYAINAAIILADIVNAQSDKVGLMVFDSAVRTLIAPGQGAAHRNELMEALYHVEDNRSTADYAGALRTLCQKQKRRSLVFIFTDFELPEEARDLISHISMLKKRHLPIVIFMENEKLNALAEQPATTVYGEYVQTAATEAKTERRDIFLHLAAMGIPNVESRAEDFALSAVNRYIQATR